MRTNHLELGEETVNIIKPLELSRFANKPLGIGMEKETLNDIKPLELSRFADKPFGSEREKRQ